MSTIQYFTALFLATLLMAGCSSPAAPPPGPAASSAKALTAFGFTSPAVIGTINETAHTVAVTVPFGTAVTALAAAFTTTGASVRVGTTTQVSGTTANNFTNPVVYTVTAADGSTQNYTVTVAVQGTSSISFGWSGYQTLSLASTATIEIGTTLTLNPTFTSGTDWAWFLDGLEVGGMASYAFTPPGIGVYFIRVTVMDGGVFYSGSMTVTVIVPELEE